MGSKWRKVKLALGLNLCVYGPNNHVVDNDDDEDSLPPSERRSDAALLSPPDDWTSAPPTPTSNKLKLSNSLSRSSSKTVFDYRWGLCSLFSWGAEKIEKDLLNMFGSNETRRRPSDIHCRVFALLSFPVHCFKCKAWKPNLPSLSSKVERNSPARPQPGFSDGQSKNKSGPEPAIFNDDESLDHETNSTDRSFSNKVPVDCDDQRKVSMKTYTEVSAVAKSSSSDSFTVLLHLKAPVSNSWHSTSRNDATLPKISLTPRAPVDLVTVLDISGSMAGTKLALLKRAMGFVIQNLGPNDRLAVIAFSSTARRLFPLRRMSEAGRQQALQAVNSLVANGGTNIAEGLRKGAKIMEDRREKNPVASIILLSDGQDTYTVNNIGGNQNRPNYQLLLPLSIRPDETSGFKIPVHAFGFGADHDASSMHSISEISGGTFSFIETEGVIQDAFAQCIGGLLSVVVKDLHVKIECVHPTVYLRSLKAGSYPNRVLPNQRLGSVDVGDLYADEERDFLVSVNVPTEISSNETSLLKVSCVYNDPLTKESVTLEGEEVRIERNDVARQEDVSIEVDRQQNRIQAAEAMAQARTAAENGDLAGAVSILENIRKVLSETVSAKSHDRLCIALDAELKEMQERMASRHVYEASGRAYILSGLSSHSWQRATARGDSTDGSSLVQAYQTPSMVEMVTRSQASLLGSPSAQRLLRPVWSFASQPRPR
ncbi:UNVERIFIED_CONTAM: E3 ubiquitin-protein ligase WAV3 [Sesamum radiatum]|uniref:E3 ubiquitin-protein ligase WAV3 n=1 Tax=Sesamum radiatum TaxID=300843 RepID=A0AAW2JWL9_SESRA